MEELTTDEWDENGDSTGGAQRIGQPGPDRADEKPVDSIPTALPMISSNMPPDGWLCELTLASGRDVNLRTGVPSVTPWRASDKGIVPVSLDEYLRLLDWTGRKIVARKGGSIPADLAPILDRLAIHQSSWFDSVERFDKKFGHTVGSVEGMAKKAERLGRRWFRGMSAAAETFQ